MTVFLDASVVAGVALLETGWERIVGALAQQDDIRWSDFGRGEVVSSIASRARANGLSALEAGRTIMALDVLSQHWRYSPIESGDVAEAIGFIAQVTLSLRLPDAIHIACARRLCAVLITNDRQQFHAAQALGLAALNPLEHIR